MVALITSASYAEAHRLKRLLTDFQVLLGDAEAPVMMGSMLRIPAHTSSSYAHEMLALCLDHQVTRLFPLKTQEAQELRKSVLLFEEYGIRLVLAPESAAGDSQATPGSNLAVMLDGQCMAGELPVQHIPDLPETGIFQWQMENNQFQFRTFIIDHAGV